MKKRKFLTFLYYEESEATDHFQVKDYVPESVIQGNSLLREDDGFIAYATNYRFVTYEGIKYLAIELNACEIFVFEKLYCMDVELNNELFEMLQAVRAIRLVDGTVDFSVIIGYDFHFSYKKIDGTNKYEIFDVEPDPDSYQANICSFYDKDTIFANLNWKELKDDEIIFMREDIDYDK